ncbi:MAG: hypothetical protein Q8L26_03425 [Candidatus Omnitrophota bacterium]|nr:hypothetical protein [Candidatus Omnitrophota bacterium]
MNIDNDRYMEKQEDEFAKHEARCVRCGSCCGVTDGNLCVKLGRDACNKYFCKDYENRIGQQVTVSGKHFSCIPIRVFLQFNPPYPKCAYSR